MDVTHALPISRQAQLVGMSRGSVYYVSQSVGAADLALMRRLDELYLEHPFMGAMLRDQLIREGIDVGRKHVGRLMKRMDMAALYRKPGTSKKHPGHDVYPYLLRGLTINWSTQVWALARIIHERFCSNRGFAAATSLDAVARRSGRRARRSVGQHTVSSMPPSLAAPRACLAWRLRDFATNRHE